MVCSSSPPAGQGKSLALTRVGRSSSFLVHILVGTSMSPPRPRKAINYLRTRKQASPVQGGASLSLQSALTQSSVCSPCCALGEVSRIYAPSNIQMEPGKHENNRHQAPGPHLNHHDLSPIPGGLLDIPKFGVCICKANCLLIF